MDAHPLVKGTNFKSKLPSVSGRSGASCVYVLSGCGLGVVVGVVVGWVVGVGLGGCVVVGVGGGFVGVGMRVWMGQGRVGESVCVYV